MTLSQDRKPDWNLIASFLAVFEHHTLTAAAQATGISQPTLGRHIDELETSLGTTLFNRGRSGMLPTEAALSIADEAKAMRQSVDAISLTAAGQAESISGTVRITASQFVATYILPDILRDLLIELPEIEVELVASDQQDNLLARDADIAIRMVRPTQNDLIARHVNSLAVGAFAHEDYLARFGEPQNPDELADHIVLGFDRNDLILRNFIEAGMKIDRHFFRYRCDDQVANWQTVCAGAGIGFGQLVVARQTPALKRILPMIEIEKIPMWLVSHRELKTSKRIRLVSDFLGERLAKLG